MEHHPHHDEGHHNGNNGDYRREMDHHHGGEPGEDAAGGGDMNSLALRPVFLGNLIPGYPSEVVMDLFERPRQPPQGSMSYGPMPVDRIDLKRGYCFVFLKDAYNYAEKEKAERFVSEINGMEVTGLSRQLRSEFARGDGKIKRKEDERRRVIEPSDTLFVVNFHEETTRRADLEMLFEPFGELVRIDMKRNYAFVQFRTIEQATRAKDKCNGGKLDQSVLTVEYVARPQRDRMDGGRDGGYDRDRRGGGGGRDYRGPPRYDDRRRSDHRGPPPPYPDRGGSDSRYPSYDRDRPSSSYEDRGGRYPEDYRRGGGGSRGDSPPPPARPRERSRSRSPPPRYGRGSSSPPRGRYENDDRYDDYRGDHRRGAPSPPDYRDRRPPERGGEPSSSYRGGGGDRDRDRGYHG